MATGDATHPSDLAPIDGAVSDGAHEGNAQPMSAAGRLTAHAQDGRAGTAIRRARDGGESVGFRAADGAVRRLRRVED